MLKAGKSTMQDLRSALPDLAIEAKTRARDFERARKLAPDFADKLKRAGAFKILIPTDAGGLGASLPEWLEVAIALAEADASTGWVAAHANITAGIIHASADSRFRDESLRRSGCMRGVEQRAAGRDHRGALRRPHHRQLGF